MAAPASMAVPARVRRRRVPWRTRFFALAAVAIIGGAAWLLLGNRVFVVRSVAVSGTHLVSPAAVIAAADVPLGTPLTRVDPGAVTTRVEAIRQVASATVSIHWPDRVTIAVTERVPAMAVRMAGGGYDLIDSDGVIVRWASDRPAGLPLFSTPLSGTALRADPGVAAVAGVLTELSPGFEQTVKEVSVTQVPGGSAGSAGETEQVTLSLNGGKTVVWGDPSNAAAKNRELEIMLTSGKRYLNVSAPGTVVTR